MTCEISVAGFGGQGVLFLGKLLAFAGLYAGYEVSWLPSYGPEMRGGTANCSVIISDEAIGSPLIKHPNILVAMNDPSLRKFEPTVSAGGTIYANSSMVTERSNRTDIRMVCIAATQIAIHNGIEKSGNLIMAGSVLSSLDFIPDSAVEEAIRHCTPANRTAQLEASLKALKIGRESTL